MQSYRSRFLAGSGFGRICGSFALPGPSKSPTFAFKAQVIATVTQICDLYWDLVSAYDNEQVEERSVAFAVETLEHQPQQLELQAIPEMDC